MAGKVFRQRVWAFLMYEESAPDDWERLLEETHIPAAISPLHDRDVWTAADEAENPEHKAGTVKKPHWHCVLYYSGKKSAEQVLQDLEALGVKRVVRVGDTKGYNRYLCHLDNDDKARYPTRDIRRLNGAACDISRTLSQGEKDAEIREMTQFIRENNVTEYAEFVFWCLEHEEEHAEWFTLARTQTVYFRGVLSSVRHSYAKSEVR